LCDIFKWKKKKWNSLVVLRICSVSLPALHLDINFVTFYLQNKNRNNFYIFTGIFSMCMIDSDVEWHHREMNWNIFFCLCFLSMTALVKTSKISNVEERSKMSRGDFGQDMNEIVRLEADPSFDSVVLSWNKFYDTTNSNLQQKGKRTTNSNLQQKEHHTLFKGFVLKDVDKNWRNLISIIYKRLTT